MRDIGLFATSVVTDWNVLQVHQNILKSASNRAVLFLKRTFSRSFYFMQKFSNKIGEYEISLSDESEAFLALFRLVE